MVKVGMMIADRYEVIEKIGTGGMSDVYRAKCHKLNRFVAVKVLKQEFSENADFVSKFRVEAQAAAGLMHPNIVNVYDVGEESGFHYIVMELVEGITLKKYIEKKARLSVKEAVSIAIQVSMGIDAAHNNHIIHRDIKPQNIIISKDGKVKVTDFGIAKAATSNTITSNVMGSVHYTSPEQVRGGFSDEKSDIYSLGITLFEMLTGRVPFNGETTVAVAIKHIQEPMPSPREYVSEVPVSVEQIVLKCTQKSPDRRYQSAPELIEDLKKSLISPDENFVKMEQQEDYGETRNFSDKELSAIRRQARERDDYEEQLQGAKKTLEKDVRQKTNGTAKKSTGKIAPVDDGAEPAKKSSSGTKAGNTQSMKNTGNKKNSGNGKTSGKTNTTKKNTSSGKKRSKKNEADPKMEMLTTILIVIAAVIIGCVFLYVVARVLGINLVPSQENTTINTMSKSAAMPQAVGLDAELATNNITSAGFVVDKKFQESSTVAENVVISSSIEAGTMTELGETVTLTISSGANGADLPDVSAMNKAEATATLENDGYVVQVIKENSDSVPKDQVIRQVPEGHTKVARGTKIEVYVSLGPESVQVTMPTIVGKSEEEALSILNDNGLVPVKGESEYSSQYEAGQVTWQNYSAGITINSGTEIQYKVSLGQEQVYYNCYTQVQAPADYNGGEAQVVLKGSDGSQLYATNTNTFPVDINVSNLFAIPYGEVYITYNVSEAQEVTDSEGNVTIQNVYVSKSMGPTRIDFTRAQ